MLTDLELAYWQLKKDRLFFKIPKKEILPECRLALKKGQDFFEAFQEYDSFALLESLPITLVESEKETSLRGQLQIFPKTQHAELNIFTTTIKKLQQQTGLPFSQIKELVIAHELYHYLSEFQLGPQREYPKLQITTFQLGPLHSKATLQESKEITAHKFAQLLTDLPFLANALDFSDLWQPEGSSSRRVQKIQEEVVGLVGEEMQRKK